MTSYLTVSFVCACSRTCLDQETPFTAAWESLIWSSDVWNKSQQFIIQLSFVMIYLHFLQVFINGIVRFRLATLFTLSTGRLLSWPHSKQRTRNCPSLGLASICPQRLTRLTIGTGNRTLTFWGGWVAKSLLLDWETSARACIALPLYYIALPLAYIALLPAYIALYQAVISSFDVFGSLRRLLRISVYIYNPPPSSSPPHK